MAGTSGPQSERVKAIFQSTSGRCHFCGDRLVLSRYATRPLRRNLLRSKGWGWRAGYWEIDHVVQRDKGGRDATANYLPACIGCNRLRWHRKGKYTRESILLGLIARHEIRPQARGRHRGAAGRAGGDPAPTRARPPWGWRIDARLSARTGGGPAGRSSAVIIRQVAAGIGRRKHSGDHPARERSAGALTTQPDPRAMRSTRPSASPTRPLVGGFIVPEGEDVPNAAQHSEAGCRRITALVREGAPRRRLHHAGERCSARGCVRPSVSYRREEPV